MEEEELQDKFLSRSLFIASIAGGVCTDQQELKTADLLSKCLRMEPDRCQKGKPEHLGTLQLECR